MAVTHRLVVDPIRCDGRGICAELFPERITLDDWGYPIVDSTTLDRTQLRDARRAVQLCPVLALRLETSRSVTIFPRRGLAGHSAGTRTGA